MFSLAIISYLNFCLQIFFLYGHLVAILPVMFIWGFFVWRLRLAPHCLSIQIGVRNWLLEGGASPPKRQKYISRRQQKTETTNE